MWNWIRRTEPSGEHRTTGPRTISSDETCSGGWDRSDNCERASSRFEARLVVSLEFDDTAFVGFTENLSESGVFISTHAVPPVGTEVSLLIALPDLVLVRAQGTVRWLRDGSPVEGRTSGMGIRFDQLSPLDAVRIHEFIRGRQSRRLDTQGASLRSA